MGEDLGLPPITGENLVAGLVVLAAGVLLSFLLRLVIRLVLRWRRRSPSSQRVFGIVTQGLVLVLTFVAAVTVIFPSVKPVNALGGIGVISIAAGIAFQTVLGNMFAGLVILSRDAFRVGDQIEVEGVAGTVDAINLSDTAVRTYDGRLVLIPNSTLNGRPVTVQTGYEEIRSTVTITIDDQADFVHAQRVAQEAMLAAPSVLAEPAPQALLTAIGVTTVDMDLRFWSGARQLDARQAQHEVIVSVMEALRAAGVPTGSDLVVLEAGPRLLSALDGSGPDAGGPA